MRAQAQTLHKSLIVFLGAPVVTLTYATVRWMTVGDERFQSQEVKTWGSPEAKRRRMWTVNAPAALTLLCSEFLRGIHMRSCSQWYFFSSSVKKWKTRTNNLKFLWKLLKGLCCLIFHIMSVRWNKQKHPASYEAILSPPLLFWHIKG